MDSYETHLYAIFHPSPALIASQLQPEAFARHYLSGSVRHYTGKIIFAEVAPDFRNDYFPIDEYMDDVKPHTDGRPKATKFISVYRVLEHLDFEAVLHLYLSTPDAAVLRLDPVEEVAIGGPGFLRIFAEINPTRMLVLSRMNFIEFGDYITSPAIHRSLPVLFYTQLELDAPQFLDDFEQNPLMPPPIPRLHPSKLRDAIFDLNTSQDKKTKGLLLDSSFDDIPYRLVRHGFMFAKHGRYKYFRMPSIHEIEEINFKFWKTM